MILMDVVMNGKVDIFVVKNLTFTINAVGRVIFQEDASGWQSFKYDKLGNISENIHTFAYPFEDSSYTFKMNFKYDSYNRIQSISYPDGEEVKYCYDHGGMLKKIYGVVQQIITGTLQGEEMNYGERLVPDPYPVPVDSVEFTYVYVDSILYNVHGLRDSVIYGNGTKTGYGYDSLLRMSSLRSYDASGNMMQNLVYDFDKAGNILTIYNSALPLPNGLGGAYFDRFAYDSLYRLKVAVGQWYGASPADYSLQMSYTHNGRISNKILSCSTYVNGVLGQDSYARRYRYDNSNRVIDITPVASSQALFNFQWDNTGNLLQMTNSHENISRQHIWTEENRLQEVLDKKWLSFYVYDSGGERVFKTVAVGDVQIVNGEERVFYSLKNATLYASPYLIVTPKGYTKHYYAESERVASQVGSSRFDGLRNGLVSSARVASKQTQLENMIHGHQAISSHQGTFFGYLDTLTVCLGDTAECYWFHFDHLGSSSWVTDSVGHAVQHLHYLPWGEDFVNQRTTDFSTRHTFSAKERDTETGLSYFGSRYYSSDLSIWLSVDPMSDKYASTTPFAYCRNNPIRLIDPNGMFDSETRANRLREKAVERYGEDRVSAVYNRTMGGGKPNFSFAIFGEGKSKYSRGGEDNEFGGPTITCDRADKVVSSRKDFRAYNRSQSTSTKSRINKLSVGLSVDFTVAFGPFGATTEIGMIKDRHSEEVSFFISKGHSVGLESSAGLNCFFGNFDQNSFAGESVGFNVNYKVLSLSNSTDINNNDPGENLGNNYFLVKFGVGVGVGGSISKSKTIVK